ncbi:hypothetical protein HDU83_001634 [Entophlyctis luteolus]|nr:hypothetical protein HDU82_006254 [Entophlyctis luteolus]KAJ3347979.1 hypothetical protein HDU83_001634 [Entophlyctis luteolus]KAJ3390512.1 hypothetical protein HDU84_007363 [Entophlyctis sp. JEL0112]
MQPFAVTVPCSTANLGPGFDALGAGLGLHMRVSCTIARPPPPGRSAQGVLTVSYKGDRPETVSLVPARNLVARVAIQTAAAHGRVLPDGLVIAIENPIPLGRGLGSSGSAVVAGIVVANEALSLKMSVQRILDFAMLFEGHPDNVAASILGGFVASYTRQCPDKPPVVHFADGDWETYHKIYRDIPLLAPPPLNLGTHLSIPISKHIKFVAVIPEFELQTKLARSVLPKDYSRSDVIFNIQRASVLVAALSVENPDPATVSEAMQDCVHQKYRQHLVPGLSEILELSPKKIPGLLGVCMSGAGPTVLCLATANFEQIGQSVVDIFSKHTVGEAPGCDELSEEMKSKNIKAVYQVLEVSEGFRVER